LEKSPGIHTGRIAYITSLGISYQEYFRVIEANIFYGILKGCPPGRTLGFIECKVGFAGDDQVMSCIQNCFVK